MPWYSFRVEGQPLLQSAIQNRFETIFIAAGGPPQMLLIEHEHLVGVSTLWMRLPDTKFLSAFPEFGAGDESKLPEKAILLIGHNQEFEKQFAYGRDE